MKVLQCHSKGDKRFSAFYAKIHMKNRYESIETLYQEAKRDANGNQVKKGAPVFYLQYENLKLPAYFLSQFYDLLWVQYFMENKDLFDYAKTFDDYKDIFNYS